MNSVSSSTSDEAAEDDRLRRLLSYVKADGRVCPMPDKWNQLWKLLPERQQVGVGWQPPLPLILGAWWHSSAEEKQDRLEMHLRYAAEHSVLIDVEEFLLGLQPEEWAYGDGTERVGY